MKEEGAVLSFWIGKACDHFGELINNISLRCSTARPFFLQESLLEVPTAEPIFVDLMNRGDTSCLLRVAKLKNQLYRLRQNPRRLEYHLAIQIEW